MASVGGGGGVARVGVGVGGGLALGVGVGVGVGVGPFLGGFASHSAAGGGPLHLPTTATTAAPHGVQQHAQQQHQQQQHQQQHFQQQYQQASYQQQPNYHHHHQQQQQQMQQQQSSYHHQQQMQQPQLQPQFYQQPQPQPPSPPMLRAQPKAELPRPHPLPAVGQAQTSFPQPWPQAPGGQHVPKQRPSSSPWGAAGAGGSARGALLMHPNGSPMAMVSPPPHGATGGAYMWPSPGGVGGAPVPLFPEVLPAGGWENGGGGVGAFGQQMQQQQQQRAPRSKTLVPCTVKLLASARHSEEEDCYQLDYPSGPRNVNMVSLVGLALSRTDHPTFLVFNLDDGTGIIEVRRFFGRFGDDDPEAAAAEALAHAQWSEGTYVRVIGGLRSIGDGSVKNVVAQAILPVVDFNEVTCHFLECAFLHLRASNPARWLEISGSTGGGGGGGGGGAAAGAAGPQHNSSSGQNLAADVIAILRAAANEGGLSVAAVAAAAQKPDAQVLETLQSLAAEGFVVESSQQPGVFRAV